MSNFPGQAKLSKDYGIRFELEALSCGSDGHNDSKVCCWLGQLNATYNIYVNVLFGQIKLGALFEHGNQKVYPVEVNATCRALGVAIARTIYQGLDFDKQRTCALKGCKHHRAVTDLAFGQQGS